MTRLANSMPTYSPARNTLFSLLLSGFICSTAFGQDLVTVGQPSSPAVSSKNALPTPITAQSLTGLDFPPQMAVIKPAIPPVPNASNLASEANANNPSQLMDLISLYREAAFSDPVMASARFQYVANQEQYWQGLSVLMPQVSAAPGLTRYYQHAVDNSALTSYAGNGRVFGQKNYTVSLTQPLVNLSAFEVYKQGTRRERHPSSRSF